jgi:co-chaperonin GroES (HSP10)
MNTSTTELLKVPASPVTYKVLCEVPDLDTTDPDIERIKAMGLQLPKSATQREEVATVVLRVLDWGPDAFGDSKRFPGGPVCEKGDYILVRAYTGTRLMYGGRELRIINDDHIDMVIHDLDGFSRPSFGGSF